LRESLVGGQTINTEQLIQIHEKNKEYLRSVGINNNNVRIIDRFRENILLEYLKSEGRTRCTYRYVRVRDSSTDKLVFLSVPNNIRSCKGAIAWTFGFSEREYDLFFET